MVKPELDLIPDMWHDLNQKVQFLYINIKHLEMLPFFCGFSIILGKIQAEIKYLMVFLIIWKVSKQNATVHSFSFSIWRMRSKSAFSLNEPPFWIPDSQVIS